MSNKVLDKTRLCKKLSKLKQSSLALNRKDNPFYPKEIDSELARIFDDYPSLKAIKGEDKRKLDRLEKQVEKLAKNAKR